MSDEKDFTTLDEVWAELSRDPEFVKEDYRQRPYFEAAKDLLRLRIEADLTQQEVAERAKTHQSRISKLESGDLDFKLSTLIAVAEALDSHVDIRVCRNFFVTDDEFKAIAASSSLPIRTVTSTAGAPIKVEPSAHMSQQRPVEIAYA